MVSSGFRRRLVGAGSRLAMRAFSPLAAFATAALLSSPADAGSGALDAARAYARQHRGLCLIVRKGGRTLSEDYWLGAGPDRPQHVYSITKSLWALAAAQAVRDGLLDLDEPACKTLPEWRDAPAKRAITIRHLLSMTSGLDPGYSTVYGQAHPDKALAALRLPLRTPPGTAFDYGPASTEVFGEVLERKLAGRGTTPLAYLGGILAAAGPHTARLECDPAGNPICSAGARLTPRHLAAVGEFVLARAKGSGPHRELFEGSAPNPAYGLGFWLNTRAAAGVAALETDVERALSWPPGAEAWRRTCIARAAPPDMVTMLGSNDQRVYIVPSLQTVVVRLGAGSGFDDAAFWARLRPAL